MFDYDITFYFNDTTDNIIDKNLEINNNRNKDRLFISHISRDYLGNIWISAKEGIFMYNIKEDQRDYLFILNNQDVKKYNIKERDIEDIYNFENNEIKFYKNIIFNDSKNNTWLSTSNGAIRYSREKDTFDIFKREIESKHSISSNVITCFYEDSNGTIWIGTDKGVNILNDNMIFNYING